MVTRLKRWKFSIKQFLNFISVKTNCQGPDCYSTMKWKQTLNEQVKFIFSTQLDKTVG